MKDIRFRAWYIPSNTMLGSGYVLNISDGSLCSEGFDSLYPPGWPGEDQKMPSDCKDEDLTLMQFTGLLDKNGKEICESDIVRVGKFNGIYDYEGLAIVCFDTWGTRFRPPDGQQYWALGDHFNSTKSYCPRLVEIVGNIYQNPELLPKEYGG